MKTIALNFKANLTRKETKEYLKNLEILLDNYDFKNKKNSKSVKKMKLIVFPNIASLFKNKFRNFSLGAQNAVAIESGTFTGEIGADVLRGMKINTILIGHSERRSNLHEDSKMIKNKFDFYKALGFNIIFCVGENLKTYAQGNIKEFLQSQLDGIDLNYKNLTIAYEPIWAIGAKEAASTKDVKSAVDILRALGGKKILYGGSVNAQNAKELLDVTDGLLIGSYSLNVKHVMKLLKNLRK